MGYYISRIIDDTFSAVIERVKTALKSESFGILTEIDVAQTLKAKIGETFHPYVILGACNPKLAYSALQKEDKIGVLLPCNVIVQERDGKVEVAAVDPVASLGRVGNPELLETAEEVKRKLSRVIGAI